MKHDENKIEELETHAYYYGGACGHGDNIKKYAEHMVQQERERIVNIVNSVNVNRNIIDTFEELLNLINKEE